MWCRPAGATSPSAMRSSARGLAQLDRTEDRARWATQSPDPIAGDLPPRGLESPLPLGRVMAVGSVGPACGGGGAASRRTRRRPASKCVGSRRRPEQRAESPRTRYRRVMSRHGTNVPYLLVTETDEAPGHPHRASTQQVLGEPRSGRPDELPDCGEQSSRIWALISIRSRLRSCSVFSVMAAASGAGNADRPPAPGRGTEESLDTRADPRRHPWHRIAPLTAGFQHRGRAGNVGHRVVPCQGGLGERVSWAPPNPGPGTTDPRGSPRRPSRTRSRASARVSPSSSRTPCS